MTQISVKGQIVISTREARLMLNMLRAELIMQQIESDMEHLNAVSQTALPTATMQLDYDPDAVTTLLRWTAPQYTLDPDSIEIVKRKLNTRSEI